MAVYTKLEHKEVDQFLEQYNINNFKDFKEITEGVENTNYRDWETDRKSTRLNSSHLKLSRMPSSA